MGQRECGDNVNTSARRARIVGIIWDEMFRRKLTCGIPVWIYRAAERICESEASCDEPPCYDDSLSVLSDMRSSVTVGDSGRIDVRLALSGASGDMTRWFSTQILDPAIAEQLGVQLIGAATESRIRKRRQALDEMTRDSDDEIREALSG